MFNLTTRMSGGDDGQLQINVLFHSSYCYDIYQVTNLILFDKENFTDDDIVI